MSDTNVGRNIWFTSVSTLIPSGFTYLFWIVTAKVAGPETVGTVSSLVAFSLIISTISSLDIHIGMKRFLGIATSRKDLGKFKQILFSTITFLLTATGVTLACLAIFSFSVFSIFSTEEQYYWIIVLMVISINFNNTLTEALISALRSKALISALVIGSILRFPILIVAVYAIDSVDEGAALSYISLYMISAVYYALYMVKYLRGSKENGLSNFKSNLKEVLSSAVAGWIPHLINVLGSQLSIVTVFIMTGPVEAGKFYIPQAIFSLVLFAVGGITKVSHPLIAGMTKSDDQVSFLRNSLKLAYLITSPITAPLLFFSRDFILILGPQFISADITLTLFMANIPLAILSEMVYYFAYGKGDNRIVFTLGLFGNIPRILLYFLLIPIWDANGAAIAFLVGTTFQFAWTIVVVKRIYHIDLEYDKYIFLTTFPLLLGLLTWLLVVQYLVATCIVIAGSIITFIRFGLFTDAELETILFSIFPERISKKMYQLGHLLLHKISKN